MSISGSPFFGGILDGKFNKNVVHVQDGVVPTIVTNICGDISSGGTHPCARIFHTFSSFSVNESAPSLVVYGGLDNNLKVLNDLFILKDVHGYPAWFLYKNTSLPFRYGHTALVVKHTLYVFGGKNENHEYCKDLIMIPLLFADEEPGMINIGVSARMGHNMHLLDENTLLISGGINTTGVLHDIFTVPIRSGRINMRGITFTIQGPDLSLCFSSPFMSMNKTTLMVIGGFDGVQWSSNVYVLDVIKKTWKIYFTDIMSRPGVAWASYIPNGVDFVRIGGISATIVTQNIPKLVSKISVMDFRKRIQVRHCLSI
jgi:hypothetical protein